MPAPPPPAHEPRRPDPADPSCDPGATPVVRVQTGVRIEKRTLKVLKALAEYLDLTLGDLLEGIVLHAFEGRAAFGPETLAAIADLRSVYGHGLGAGNSRGLVEAP